MQLRLRYKPYGVIDFNRPDLFARAVMEALPKIIWLGDIEGWRGEPDAYLSIDCEREIEVFGDLPRHSHNNSGLPRSGERGSGRSGD